MPQSLRRVAVAHFPLTMHSACKLSSVKLELTLCGLYVHSPLLCHQSLTYCLPCLVFALDLVHRLILFKRLTEAFYHNFQQNTIANAAATSAVVTSRVVLCGYS